MSGTLKLRVIGRPETIPPSVQRQIREDLPFEVDFQLIEGIAGLQQVLSRPDTFDIYHQWHTGDLMWTARAIQPIDLGRVRNGTLVKLQALSRRGDASAMGALFNSLFRQPSGELGAVPTDEVAMLPLLYGADSFGYLPALRGKVPDIGAESWGWLLDDRLHGSVGMFVDPALGAIEAALAVEARDGIVFPDIGNLSLEELDHVFEVLLHKKRIGHFKGFWRNHEESVRFMRRGVLAQSIFSPAVAMLRGGGTDVRLAVPQEGYRGWHVDLCLSAAAEGERLEAAYAYLDWWMSGRGGAMLARQGYYFVLPDLVRDHLTPEEWGYWYAGEPAQVPLSNQLDEQTIRPGDLREGGSHFERMSRVRVWNTFMDEHNYLVRRWKEFLQA